MAWNELYTGLQQGTVDGLVSSKMPIIQQGLIDVLKYATDTNHSYSINVIPVSYTHLDVYKRQVYILVLLVLNFVLPYILSFILSAVIKRGQGLSLIHIYTGGFL